MINEKTHEVLSSLTGFVFAAIFPAVWLYWIITGKYEGEELVLSLTYLLITLSFIHIPFFLGLFIGAIFWAFFLKK